MEITEQFEIGCDEAGRGPWAGPIVAACCQINDNEKKYLFSLGIKDSKTLTAKQRQSLFEQIKNKIIWSVGVVSAKEIDTLGLQRANVFAYEKALLKLNLSDEQIINCDYVGAFNNYWQLKNKVLTHIKGESKFISIATASIVAKVWRDEYMNDLATKYPKYGFEKHVGYGTKLHLDAINQWGVLECHRKSFAPIKKIIDGIQ